MPMVKENLSKEEMLELISEDPFFGDTNRFEIRWRLEYDEGRHKNASILLKIPGKKLPIEIDSWTSNYRLIEAITNDDKRRPLVRRVLSYEKNPELAGMF